MRNKGQKLNSARHAAIWQWNFFWTMLMVQAITTPSLRCFQSTVDFIKTSDFPIGLYAWQLAEACQPQYKPMLKSLISKIYIKSVIYWKNLKLGVVIAWTISIVKKKKKRFVAILTCLEKFDILAPISHAKGLPYTRKFSPGENFRQLHHLFSLAKFLSREFFVQC